MDKLTGYRCSLCGKTYQPGEIQYTCPEDGGNLDVVLDYDSIQKSIAPETIFASTDASLWRYLPLLPVADPQAHGDSAACSGLDAGLQAALPGANSWDGSTVDQG